MDCADRVGALVALAGVVAGAAFVIGRRVGLRIIQSVAMTSAQKTYGVQPVEPVRGRFGDRLLAASAGGVLLVVMIAGPQLTTAKLPRPMAPVAAAAARLEYERVRSEDGHRPMSGPATFALREAPGSPPELILSAAWSGKVVWTTELPARPVEGLPMAEAEGAGTVVVAATDLRTGGNLRLIGVDASSGRIRYVHRHPAKSNEPVYVVAAGSLVLVWSGQLAGVDPDSGRVTWITAGGE